MHAADIVCTCGNKISVPDVTGEVICPKCKFHITTAYMVGDALIFTEPGSPPPKDPKHHEHQMTLLVAAESTGDFKVPIRWCHDCGMVIFEFEKTYVMIPEWSREKLEAMSKETLKFVQEPPMSVTKPVGGKKRQKVLGRGLKDLLKSAPSVGDKGLASLFGMTNKTK